MTCFQKILKNGFIPEKDQKCDTLSFRRVTFYRLPPKNIGS